MKSFLFALITLILAACSAATAPDAGEDPAAEPPAQSSSPTPAVSADEPAAATPQPFRADLENFGLAPELENEVWLNTGQPMRLADLRGKVVLLDMWTYG